MIGEVVDAIGSLDRAVGDTFENMAFNQITEKHSLSFLPPWADYAIGTLIEIHNPINARMFLVVNEDHAKEMLSIISGSDDFEDDQSQIFDIIREIANEIGGRFATGILKKGEEAEVGLPTIVDTKQIAKSLDPDKYQLMISYQIEENEVICCLEHEYQELAALSEHKPHFPDEADMQIKLESTRIHSTRLQKKLDKITQELMNLDRYAHFGFVAEGMVHNMNNMLTGIIGNAQIMQLQIIDLENPDSKKRIANEEDFGIFVSEIHNRIDNILSGGRSISQSLDTILGKSRIIQSVKFEYIDLNEIIKNEINFLSTDMWFKHNVKLRMKLSNLPVRVNCIPSKTSQMIYHILQNSLDAMVDKDNPELCISTVKNGDFVHFSISDNGKGISDKLLSRIFEPYFTTKGDLDLKSFPCKARLGLGLPFCSDVVEEFNGTLEIKSENNKGTAVIIKLPYRSIDN